VDVPDPIKIKIRIKGMIGEYKPQVCGFSKCSSEWSAQSKNPSHSSEASKQRWPFSHMKF